MEKDEIEIPNEFDLLKQRNESLEEGDYMKCTITVGKKDREVFPHITGKNAGPLEKAIMIMTLRGTAEQLEEAYPETKLIMPFLRAETGRTITAMRENENE